MNIHSVELLLAEDNENDAELTIRELKKHNLTNNLVHVRNGVEVLDFIYGRGKFAAREGSRLYPKVILLDIQMPLVNGLEVLKQIKSDPETQTIPVVILTSSRENPDIKKCYELGANSYIVKPVNFEGFAESIRNLGLYWLLLNQRPDK